ncbi:MAG: hypothetical protein JW708_04190 [Vallitaleaceae bacterium]|nr:hypothetical protein [Vallitaleaceae bacterium]
MRLNREMQIKLGILEILSVVIVSSTFYFLSTTAVSSKILMVMIPLFFSLCLLRNKDKEVKPILFGGFTMISLLLVALSNLFIHS